MNDFQLIDPAVIAELLDRPEGDGDWKLLEAHFTSIDHPAVADQREVLHIPRAVKVHPSYLEAGTDRSKYYPDYQHPADGNLLVDDELVLALQRLRITPDTLVIVYGREPDGAMAAARLVWALMYAGVARVRLLDGGIDAWLDYGGRTSPTIPEACDLAENDAPGVEATIPWCTRQDLLATTAEVREISEAHGATDSKLVDVRRPGEWEGSLTDYYPFFSKAGHIPAANFQGDWENLVDMETHKLGPMLEAVSRRWRELGIVEEQVVSGQVTLIFYCGTGWRSSIAFLVATLLGLRAKNYDSGFYGWSWRGENEIATGA